MMSKVYMMLMITKMIDDSDDDKLVGTKQIEGEYDEEEDFIELSDDNDDDELVGTKQREQTCVTNLTDGFLSSAVCWEPLICESQSPKNLGGRVALSSGKFLRVRKVFARNP